MEQPRTTVSEEPYVRASLTVRYIAALAVLGILAVAGEFFRERVLDAQRSNTRIRWGFTQAAPTLAHACKARLKRE